MPKINYQRHYLCNTCGAYLDDADADQHSFEGHDVVLESDA